MNHNYLSVQTPQHPSLAPLQPSWATVPQQSTVDEPDDDYDDPDDSRGLNGDNDKHVRRRSSKACDQCRKSKCKCERTGVDGEPCRNCVMLGTECTFLGPSRKRGPPKGYIDAIENRLHQVEALIGVFINSPDPRAVSLLKDVSMEPSAREIIERVTLSPYGSKGRKKRDGGESHSHSRGKAGEGSSGRVQPFEKPIHEWQESVGKRILEGANARVARGSPIEGTEVRPLRDVIRRRTDEYNPHFAVTPTALNNKPSATSLRSMDDSPESHIDSSDSEDVASGVGQLSLNEHEQFRYHGKVSGLHLLGRHTRLDKRNEGGIWRFPQAKIWQPISHNPSFFGLRSFQPIHGLMDRSSIAKEELEREIRKRLPSREVQEHLLGLYWIYVHPVLPVLDKEAVSTAWRNGMDAESNRASEAVDITVGDSPPQPIYEAHSPSPSAVSASESSPHLQSQQQQPQARVPLLLLLSIFSISARFSARSPPVPPDPNQMWDAGDSELADRYLADARTLLNHTYSSSRPSTCQALLLLSYREIGVGAMAAAWLYVGMAVRMAQDLGMHRKAERWVWKTGSDGRGVFSDRERQVRKKIWYACVIMDKYVSTYIGRPLSIFERDFDTPYPNENDPEEMELWSDDPSDPPLDESSLSLRPIPPVPSRLLSCFNQSAKLSSILSEIVLAIYSVRPAPHSSRHAEYVSLEEKLDKWLLELPDHLTLDKFQHQHQELMRKRAEAGQENPELSNISCRCPCPPPHVFTLHMLYWCSVLLLHRPFIRARSQSANSPPSVDQESNLGHVSHKPFDLCMTAAGHITSIVSLYSEHFCLLRSPAFFTYYIFSAGIMYVTALSIQPDNPQAGLGLQKCMDCLKSMDRTWPSAGRQWELLHGSKLDLREVEFAYLGKGEQRNKRAAEEPLDPRRVPSSSHMRHNGHPEGNSDSIRLTTTFMSPYHHNGLQTRLDGNPPGVMEPSSATSDGPMQTPFNLARPYHLGLDLSGSSQQSPPASQAPSRSLFPQFERWSNSNEGPFVQPHHPPPSNMFGSGHMDGMLNGSQISPLQAPRLPTSSARSPSYWNEYNDASMMGSSLYGLPLLSDAMTNGAMGAGTQSFFSDPDYPIFSSHTNQHNAIQQ